MGEGDVLVVEWEGELFYIERVESWDLRISHSFLKVVYDCRDPASNECIEVLEKR